MKKISVLIADDHAVVRTGLAAMLGAEKDLLVTDKAKNGREVIEKALANPPDVIIMDLRMPEIDGVEATVELHRKLPNTRILVLTSFGEADDVAHALEAGAAGAVTKTAEDAELVDVVRRIAAGENYISPTLRKLLSDNPPVQKLTPRQTEILNLIVKGLTNKDIANLLHIREDSVEEHINAILTKIDAANRTEAVAIALRKHLLKI